MTADEEGFIEGMADFFTAFDDAWSRIFAMILGTRLPHAEIKEKFCEFIRAHCMGTTGELSCSEQDIIDLFPDFIEYLGDW